MNQHILNKLQELINKKGKECLLPQNLPEDILYRIEAEAIDMEEDRDDTPASLTLIAVLTLNNANIMESSGTIEFKSEKFMDNFFIYASSVRLEILRRKGLLEVEENSLPTLDNILDGNRKIAITR